MSNLFIFREEEGYEPDEKIDRIDRSYFQPDIPEVEEFLRSKAVDLTDCDDPNKTEFEGFLRENLTEVEFNELIDELFEEYGGEGDTFNMKMFSLPNSVFQQSLKDSLDELFDLRLFEAEKEYFSYLLDIENYISRNDKGVVDIKFSVKGKRENLESDEIKVQTEGGETKDLAEITDEDLKNAFRKEEYIVECRIYVEAEILVVSNSGIDKTLQEEIVSATVRWSENDD